MMKEAITWQKQKQKHYNILIDKQTVWVKTDGILMAAKGTQSWL
jgi:hypothetical protein